MKSNPKICELASVDVFLKWFVLPLMNEMKNRGWTVVGACAPGNEVENLRGQGHVIRTVQISRTFSIAMHLRTVRDLVRLFRQEKFDLVHVHTPIGALVGRIAAYIAGVPQVVYTAHGFYFHEGMTLPKRWMHIGLEWVLGRVTHILFTVSEEDARDAVRLGLMSSSRTFFVGNGVDSHRFDVTLLQQRISIRRTLGFSEGDFVIGFVGRQVREKGLIELLDAIQMLSAKYPRLCLLLVGERLSSDHDAGIELELQSAERKLGSRIVRTGSRDDVPQLIAAMDVFCLPSYREGLPMTILEAMMMARPVVATRIRGCREAVIDGVTGILVAPKNSHALALAIERLIIEQGLPEKMGNSGRTRALAEYEQKAVVGRQIDWLSEALTAGRRGA